MQKSKRLRNKYPDNFGNFGNPIKVKVITASPVSFLKPSSKLGIYIECLSLKLTWVNTEYHIGTSSNLKIYYKRLFYIHSKNVSKLQLTFVNVYREEGTFYMQLKILLNNNSSKLIAQNGKF